MTKQRLAHIAFCTTRTFGVIAFCIGFHALITVPVAAFAVQHANDPVIKISLAK